MNYDDIETMKDVWEHFEQEVIQHHRWPPKMVKLAHTLFHTGAIAAFGVFQKRVANAEDGESTGDIFNELVKEVSGIGERMRDDKVNLKEIFEGIGEFPLAAYAAAREMAENAPEIKNADMLLLAADGDETACITINRDATPEQLGGVIAQALGTLLASKPAMDQGQAVKEFIEAFARSLNSSGLCGRFVSTVNVETESQVRH